MLPGVYARNCLLVYGLTDYSEPVYLSDNMKSAPAWQAIEPPARINQKLLKVFPNPAGSYFIIEYDLRETEGRAILLLSDLTGRSILSMVPEDKQNQQLISTDSYSTGLYILQLFINNELIESHKIEISK